MTNTEPQYIDCECYSRDHLIRLWPDTSEAGFECFDIEICLHHYRKWWKRLWLGIKYIFGISNCKYGHFCCSSLDRRRVVILRDLCNAFINECDKHEKK